MPDKKIFSVSELTRLIRGMLEEALPAVWVEGEISNFIRHSSGHIYFSIRDANAVIRCAMFRRANERLNFSPKDGMKVICFGSISLYEARGDYQLIVENIEPKGIGALQLKFEEFKAKLAKEGLFDQSHKVPIPYLPGRIGVVTSPTGAVIRDILNVTRRRFSNVEIIIDPVKVQGDGAKDEIAQAIDDLNKWNNVDVIIVARGGGSLEDLWAFNEEVVARAIYRSEIPVISAVGHEVDFTISDFVADLRAPTPSAAAELAIPRKEDLVDAIEAARVRLKNALSKKVDILEERFKNLKESRVLSEPLDMIMQYEQKIDDIEKVMTTSVEHLIDISSERFTSVISNLEALSPLSILRRGYSLTTRVDDGAVIRDSSKLKKGDKVSTRLNMGSFISNVEELI